MNESPQFYPVSLLAAAASVSRTTVKARARAGAWPTRLNGNRLELCPPAEMRAALPSPASSPVAVAPPEVTFTEIADEITRQRILFRETAVLWYRDLKEGSDEMRLQKTAAHFLARHRGTSNIQHSTSNVQRNPLAPFSARQLRR